MGVKKGSNIPPFLLFYGIFAKLKFDQNARNGGHMVPSWNTWSKHGGN